MYGVQPGEESFANNCLLARKMVEQGVRFVQLYDWGWDSHGASPTEALDSGFLKKCKEMIWRIKKRQKATDLRKNVLK